MENKNELGHIYGARISKSGKWLNLTIAAEINGEKRFIVCPVRMPCNADATKPVAAVDETRATISGIPVYEDAKQDNEAKADDLPF